MLHLRLCLAAMLVLSLCSACQKAPPAENSGAAGKLSVVTTLFPLYDFARIICKDKANVKLLLPPGVESHSFEPKPSDLVAISKADIFIYTNPVMEPWATKVVKNVAPSALKIVDASRGTTTLPAERHSHEKHGHADDTHQHDDDAADPHIWLDFKNAEKIVETLTSAVIDKDPGNAAFYTANATSLKAELAKLDRDFNTGLHSCRTRFFIHGGHYAFGYLAHRYGLTYHSAQAINPDAEPTPATIAQLLKLVKNNGLNHVFAEEMVSPRTSEMIAKEAGITILMLHGAHNISKDDLAGGTTFIGLMRKNLENLRIGLGCR